MKFLLGSSYRLRLIIRFLLGSLYTEANNEIFIRQFVPVLASKKFY